MILTLKRFLYKQSEGGEAFESGSTVIFKRRQVVHLSADGPVNYSEGAVGAAAAAAGGFRTDTEISGRQHDHLFGRELQAASSWLDPQLDSSELEDSKRRSSKVMETVERFQHLVSFRLTLTCSYVVYR